MGNTTYMLTYLLGTVDAGEPNGTVAVVPVVFVTVFYADSTVFTNVWI